MTKVLPRLLSLAAAVLLAASSFGAATKPTSPEKSDSLLGIMQKELNRANANLAKANPVPYFISYSVLDHSATVMVASQGALYTSTDVHRRQADVSVRVGSYQLDNTHGKSRYSGLSSALLPLSDDPDAVARSLWRLTDREYKKAAEAFVK